MSGESDSRHSTCKTLIQNSYKSFLFIPYLGGQGGFERYSSTQVLSVRVTWFRLLCRITWGTQNKEKHTYHWTYHGKWIIHFKSNLLRKGREKKGVGIFMCVCLKKLNFDGETLSLVHFLSLRIPLDPF